MFGVVKVGRALDTSVSSYVGIVRGHKGEPMLIRCISTWEGAYIRVGKIYEVARETANFYYIRTEDGRELEYYKDRFVIVCCGAKNCINPKHRGMIDESRR